MKHWCVGDKCLVWYKRKDNSGYWAEAIVTQMFMGRVEKVEAAGGSWTLTINNNKRLRRPSTTRKSLSWKKERTGLLKAGRADIVEKVERGQLKLTPKPNGLIVKRRAK